jgi:hypothetical protein
MAIKLTKCPDVHVETVSVAHRDLYEDGQNLGVYPKYFAECEAMDIINDRVSDFKDAGATLEGTEAIVRNVIRALINAQILEPLGSRQNTINDLYKMGASAREIQELMKGKN